MLNELDGKLLRIILEAKRPISNKELALLCDVAVNTVRKEIKLINEEIAKHGFCIASKTSVGSYLEVTKPRIAGPYISRMQELYQRNLRMVNHYPVQIHYLSRKYLCSANGVSAESICQEMFCSRGTLMRWNESVKRILARYNLRLKSGRNGQGLSVEGCEWNRRQCLIYEHKIYKTTIESNAYVKSNFESLFFMVSGETNYYEAHRLLREALGNQRDFALPILQVPKIIHYIQLSVSRRKYSAEISFSGEQTQRVVNTAEYAFAKSLCEKLEGIYKKSFLPQDVLGVAILLLSYESQNSRLHELPDYDELYAETQEMIDRIMRKLGYGKELFDDEFVDDWICFLYTLKNKLFFEVYVDREVIGYVDHKGIRTADLCLDFARFYEEKHGVHLSNDNTMSACYLFHRLFKREVIDYNALNLLVMSHYGKRCAKSLAANIRFGYGSEVGLITPFEFCEKIDDVERYDLIITDLSITAGGRRYLTEYNLPVLSVQFALPRHRYPELDAYLQKKKWQREWELLKDKSFFATNLKNKDEVWRYAASLFANYGESAALIEKHLRENDSYVDQERENGVVLMPVMMEGIGRQYFFVLINQEAIKWNQSRSQIFVCYNRIASPAGNWVLNDLLKRFVHISAVDAADLVRLDKDPIDILFPEAQPEPDAQDE